MKGRLMMFPLHGSQTIPSEPIGWRETFLRTMGLVGALGLVGYLLQFVKG